jgi:hypothetical protein
MVVKKLVIMLLLMTPIVSFASFSDMYGTWVERLLGNPTATYEQLSKWTDGYGQANSIEASIIAPDGEWKITVTTDMYTNTGNDIAWSFAVQASWTVDEQSAAIDVWANIIIASWTMYAKPTFTTLPTDLVSRQEAIGYEFLDGKWLEVTDTLWVNTGALLSVKPLEISQKLVSIAKETPVFTSTYETQRNGYTIHVVDIDQAGIEKLFAWVVNTITTPLWLPAEETLMLPPEVDLKQDGVKTFGVLWQKGDEIKMWIIVKQNPGSEYVLISSTVTPTTSSLMFRLAKKRGNKPLVQFWYDTETKSATEHTTKINFFATEEDLDIESTISSRYYDSSDKPEITAPTGAILLSDLMAQ